MPPPNKLWSADQLDGISQALTDQGYIVLTKVMPDALIAALHSEATSLSEQDYATAATGRDTNRSTNTLVRTDSIYWMDTSTATAKAYLEYTETLRLELNRRLFLGLFDYECHYACYTPGAYYRRHTDAFVGRRNRVLSSVLYLNADWQQGDGGELVMYADQSAKRLQVVEPELNTLVLFLSERFPHEVLPAKRNRYSLTGWFRVNSSNAQQVDPAR